MVRLLRFHSGQVRSPSARWNWGERSVIYKKTMPIEQRDKQPKSKLVPVEGRPGIYTWEGLERKPDPLTAVRGIILREKYLRSQRGKSST